MRNYPEWIPVFWATQVLGLVLVPLNAWWTAAELRYALADAGARLVIADAERTTLLAPHLGELGRPPLIEVRGSGRTAPGVRRWDDLLASLDPEAAPPDVEVIPDDDSTILYTSGTTGLPKGAIGSHRNHCTNVRNTQLGAFVNAVIRAGGEPPAPDQDTPQPGTLCTFPLFHIAGITSIGATPLTGGKLVTQYKWDRTEARELIRRERLTGVSGVPTVMRQVIEDAAVHPEDYASLAGIAMGGAPIPPVLIGRVDGWFHSGDLGRVADGWVYVVDRMKDVIIRGGENIYCAEVEAALFEHPAIEEAAVVGVPHETLGEEAVAVVVRHDGASLAAGDVQRHVAERLALFKVPAHVVFWSGPLPRTESGKVLKRDLRSAVAAKVRAR
jgi:acyl-CoA synthetase (AMP-forming)/AMP-acid ligase II